MAGQYCNLSGMGRSTGEYVLIGLVVSICLQCGQTDFKTHHDKIKIQLADFPMLSWQNGVLDVDVAKKKCDEQVAL
jgi:hypothetical protein